jgi:acyl dehydratase
MEWIHFEEIETPSSIAGPSRRVERDEMVAFAQRWDPLPIHLDEEAAKPFGGLTASGSFLLALRLRLIHDMDRQPAVIASFGYDEVRFKAPVHAGDELKLVIDFEKKRESASKPDRGIVTMRETLINQRGEVVLHVIDTVLVWKRLA